jgi:hypothetical protein
VLNGEFMADKEKVNLDAIRAERLRTEARRPEDGSVVLPVMTTGQFYDVVQEAASTVGLLVDVRANYAQKGSGPIPLIIDLDSLVRLYGPDALKLLEGAVASWVVKKVGDSIWTRIVAWVHEVQKKSPDGASLQAIAVDEAGQRRNYKVPSGERLEAAITQLSLDLNTPGAPGERLWVDGRWMTSAEYFSREKRP